MPHCDREDFDFHHSYEVHGDRLVRLNAVDEMTDWWLLTDAPEDELYAAADDLGILESLPVDLSVDDLRAAIRAETQCQTSL